MTAQRLLDPSSSSTAVPRRLPEGYAGHDHETLGSDILSVLNALLLPDAVLGAPLLARVRAVKADGWYPIALLFEVLDVLDARVGKAGLRQMGRRLFAKSHQERVGPSAKSAGDILFGIDGMYRHANRGHDIGGWKVVHFQPGRGRLEKRTPHHCAMEEGILSEALKVAGVPALVTQSQCLREGAPFCVFEVSASVTDVQWRGAHPLVR